MSNGAQPISVRGSGEFGLVTAGTPAVTELQFLAQNKTSLTATLQNPNVSGVFTFSISPLRRLRG